MTKKALVVGINEYQDAGNITPLRCAEQDAWQIQNFLKRQAGFEVRSLVGKSATRRRINDAVRSLCNGLKAGDLFLFYFAGHGYEDHRGHLLLAQDVRFFELQAGAAADIIPVKSLEALTAGKGFARVLLLDACREPLHSGGRAGTATMADEAARNLSAVQSQAETTAPLALVCSCSPKQKAHEIAAIEAGAFTQSLVELFEEQLAGVKNADAFSIPRDLDTMGDRTEALLARYGIAGRQDPWFTANRSRIDILGSVANRAESPAVVPPPRRKRPHRVGKAQWWVEADGDERGPLDEEAVRELIDSGQVSSASECWRPGMADWMVLGETPEWRDAFSSPRPATPPPRQSRRRKIVLPDWLETVEDAAYPSLRGLETGSREAQQRQKEWVAKGYPLKVALKQIGMRFRLVPPGTFLMGSPNSEPDRSDAEGPQHEVRISEPFYVGKYPVTQAEWQAVMKNKPAHFKGANRPAEQVSWEDCQEFLVRCDHLLGADEELLRLLSEAEWEYACRAGTTTPQYGSLGMVGWYYANSGKETHDAGEKLANAWGLHDMIGNVWEWCADRWHDSYQGAPADGSVWSAGGDSYRVYRGGGWYNSAGFCRAAYRYWDEPGYRLYDLGLRLALSPAVSAVATE